MTVSPIRITIYQVNEARSLIAAGHTKRARRKLRHARRRISGMTDPRVRSAHRLIGQAIGRMIDLDNGSARDKARAAVECLVGVMS